MIVLDANVVLSALRSANGASNVIVRGMLEGAIPFAVSPAVALEYEEVLKRPGILGDDPWLSQDEVDIVLDALFSKATLASPRFRFRPFLEDPNDDLYVECALAAGARTIVTSDRHFNIPAVGAFGISIVKAGNFLVELGRRKTLT